MSTIDSPPATPATRARRNGPVRLTPVTVALVTIALAYSMTRLFRGTAFVVEIAVPALIAHVAAAVCRATRRRLFVTVLTSAAASLIAWAWVFFPTTRWGPFPTPRTFDAFVGIAREDFAGFRSAIAPVQPTVGYLAVASLILIVVALYADTANSFGNVALQAITCHVGIFFAATFFARGHGQIASAIVMSAAVLCHSAAARAASVGGARWRVGERKSGSERFLWRSLAATTGAAAVAIVVTASIPMPKPNGFKLEDLIPDSSRRTVVSPLVSVTDQLRSHRSEVLFEVQAPKPSYWRLTSLDTFDGTSWSAESSFDEAADGPTTNPSGTVTEHRMRIRNLGGVWLPAAPFPTEVDADFDVGINTDSSTLVTSGAKTLQEGDVYRVRSLASEDFLMAGGVDVDGIPSRLRRYLELPAEAPSAWVTNFIETQLRPIRETKDRLLALQNLFRTYSYDTSVDYKGDPDPIQAFMQARAGYCQQFSTAFAYFARLIGVPSRVAIGFTYGTYSKEKDAYVVSGKHAHAWPEVWLPADGWTAFEPTPGRGNPTSEWITGVPAAQDESDPAATSTTTTTSTPARSSTTARAPATPAAASPADTGAAAASSSSAPWVLGVGVVLAAALGAGGWWISRMRNDRRRPAAVRAWGKASTLIAWAGVKLPPNPTVGATVRAAAPLGDLPALERLGALVDEALYGRPLQESDQQDHGRQLWAEFSAFAEQISPHLTARRQRIAHRWARIASEAG